MRVSEFHPLFPPTASELKTLVVKIDREKRESQSSSEASPHMGEPKHLATDNPFEQMAQTFERRIATGTFDAKQAAKELAALIDGHPIARSIDGDRIDYKLRAAGERDERDE